MLPLLVSAALAGTDPLIALEQRQVQLYEEVAPSVVFIANGRGFGSGFAVGDGKMALTSAHVVGERETVEVVLHDGSRVTAPVLERAQGDVDLALIDLAAHPLPALGIAPASQTRVGAWVGTVGQSAGNIWSFNAGMVSNVYPDGDSRPVFQTQIPIDPGSSGGPVFGRDARVLGVVTAGNQRANSVNFAIQAEVALETLPRLRHLCDCAVVEAPVGATVLLDGEMVATGPVALHPSPGVHTVLILVDGKPAERTLRWPADRGTTLKP